MLGKEGNGTDGLKLGVTVTRLVRSTWLKEGVGYKPELSGTQSLRSEGRVGSRIFHLEEQINGDTKKIW